MKKFYKSKKLNRHKKLNRNKKLSTKRNYIKEYNKSNKILTKYFFKKTLKKLKKKQVGGILIKNNLEQFNKSITIDSRVPCLRGKLCLPCSLNSIGIDSSLLIDIIQKLEDYSRNPSKYDEKPNSINKILKYLNAYKENFFEKKGRSKELIAKNKDIIYLIGKDSFVNRDGNVQVLHGTVKVVSGNNIKALQEQLKPFDEKLPSEYYVNLDACLRIVFDSLLNGTSSLLFFYRDTLPKRGHIVGISKSARNGIPYLLECQTFEELGDKGKIYIGFEKIIEYLIKEQPEYIGFFAPELYRLQTEDDIIDYIPVNKRYIDKIPRASNNSQLRETELPPVPIARLLSFESGKKNKISDSEMKKLLEQTTCMQGKGDEKTCITIKNYKKDLDILDRKIGSRSDDQKIFNSLQTLKLLEPSQNWIYDLVKAGYIPPKYGAHARTGYFIGSKDKLQELYEKALMRKPQQELEIKLIEDLLIDLQDKEEEKEKKEGKKINLKEEVDDDDDLYN